MTHCKHLPILAIVATLALPAASYAADTDWYAANVEGMGRAFIANPYDNNAIVGSPAAVSLVERYDALANFAVGTESQWEVVGAAVDARTSPIGFGFSYRYVQENPPLTAVNAPGWILPGQEVAKRERAHQMTMALSIPLFDRRLGIGVNGTYLRSNDDRFGKHGGGNMDFGIAYRHDDAWHFAINGYNLLPLQAFNIDALPRGVAAGAYYRNEDVVAVGLDLDTQFDNLGEEGFPLSVRFGAEARAAVVQPRIGYRFEGPERRHWMAFGLGAGNESGSVDYGLSMPLNPSPLRWKALVHSFAVRLSF